MTALSLASWHLFAKNVGVPSHAIPGTFQRDRCGACPSCHASQKVKSNAGRLGTGLELHWCRQEPNVWPTEQDRRTTSPCQGKKIIIGKTSPIPTAKVPVPSFRLRRGLGRAGSVLVLPDNVSISRSSRNVSDHHRRPSKQCQTEPQQLQQRRCIHS
jgi:hypothetical protein